MTTGKPVPTNQSCPACGALVFYEGHSELRSALTPHRFHCHRCGKLYVVRSTSHKPPRFRLTGRHEVQEAVAPSGPDHVAALATDDDGLEDDAPLITADALASEDVAPEFPVESEAERSAGPTDS